MAVRIRLKRMGKKKQPTYRVVVADARAPRDGRIIEAIGRYDPRPAPSIIEIDNERVRFWLGNGAQPSDRVQKLLEISGAVRRPKVSRSGIYRLDDDPLPRTEEKPVKAADGESATEPEVSARPGDAEGQEDEGEENAALNERDGEI